MRSAKCYDASMATGNSGEALRRNKSVSSPGWKSIQPLFEVLFWGVLVFQLVAYLADEEARFGVAVVLPAFLALGINWLLLPRSREVPLHRKLWSLTFLAVVFLVGLLTGSVLFYFVAVVNGVYVFGLARGSAYAAGALALLCLQNVLSGESVLGGSAASAGDILGEALLVWGPAFLFVVGMSAAAVEADRRTRQARELLKELEEAHLQLGHYAARVRELSVHEERTRMARGIHDSMDHYMTAAGLQLEAAQTLLVRQPKKAEERLGSARASISGALSEVRRSVRALKPLTVEERSGTGALRALMQSFEEVGPEVSLEVTGEERELPHETELVLYRTLQEGLTNALKHSGASRIQALPAFGPETVQLSISDDGYGVSKNVQRADATPGFGLQALEERVES
ncbi:sensor histidine kinase [soil metagenome]